MQTECTPIKGAMSLRMNGSSLSGTPRMWAITLRGWREAISVMKSHSPRGPKPSTSFLAVSSTSESSCPMARGVKNGVATARYLRCSGGSMLMIVLICCCCPELRPRFRERVIPGAFRNRFGCFEISTICACFVTAQNDGQPGGSKKRRGS